MSQPHLHRTLDDPSYHAINVEAIHDPWELLDSSYHLSRITVS